MADTSVEAAVGLAPATDRPVTAGRRATTQPEELLGQTHLASLQQRLVKLRAESAVKLEAGKVSVSEDTNTFLQNTIGFVEAITNWTPRPHWLFPTIIATLTVASRKRSIWCSR